MQSVRFFSVDCLRVSSPLANTPINCLDQALTNFLEIIQMRTGSILDDFRKLQSPPIMAVSPRISIENLGRSLGGSFVESSNGQFLTFYDPTSAERSFVMVRPLRKKYKQCYINFINSRYNANFSIVDFPKDFDVDHLLARSNSPAKTWVRLEAVNYKINRSHGGGVEKRNASSGVTMARKSAEHRPASMTWLVAAKLAMIRSPLLGREKSVILRKEAFIDYFVAQGFERAHVEVGINACQHDLPVLK